MQLRPHFLFNALNTITGMIRTGDSRGAVQRTAGLVGLLRTVLRSDGTQEVPLSQELEFVEHYLRLEQLRFEEWLRTRIHVAPEVVHALVPHLLLQPLVENAVRHGSRGGTAQNQVDITVTREAEVDDERMARKNLRVLLAGDPVIVVVDECASGAQAVQALRQPLCMRNCDRGGPSYASGGQGSRRGLVVAARSCLGPLGRPGGDTHPSSNRRTLMEGEDMPRSNGRNGPTGVLPDLVCLSHLRWGFVFQRPQHLMSRFARERRVFFVEEPAWGPGPTRLEVNRSPEGVWVAVPHIEVEGATKVTPDPPPGTRVDPEYLMAVQRELLEAMLADQGVNDFVLWYYTPMALAFSHQLRPRAVVYDCMDELSAFTGAPPILVQRERELMRRAHVMFTGGHHLYEAKREQHPNVHPFPSSVDVPHFAQARQGPADPADQAGLPRPRIGFCGVIDERMDLALVEGVARARPDWQLVMVGPVVKISPEALPRLPNIHYLGGKSYQELPAYLAHWDVAMTPFARTPATRFLSPTKTPEYLAAGRPVVSTSIRDVVRPYGEQGLVRIADTPEAFVQAVEESLSQSTEAWLPRVDAFLSGLSWDHTWRGMRHHIDEVVERAETEPTAYSEG